MPERTDSHGNSPEPVDKLLHPEASDKKAETVKSSDSTAVAALQNEVIRLRRQEKRTASETDSINGRVEDYSSLLASITPKSEVPTGTTESAIPSLPDEPSLDDTKASVLSSLSPGNKSNLPLSVQDNLIAAAENNELPIKPEQKLAFSPPPRIVKGDVQESPATQEIASTSQSPHPPSLSKMQFNHDIGTQIAFDTPSLSRGPQISDDIQIASNSATEAPVKPSATSEKSTFSNTNFAAEVAFQPSPMRSVQTRQSNVDNTLAAAESRPSNNNTNTAKSSPPTEIAFAKEAGFSARDVNTAIPNPLQTPASNSERTIAQSGSSPTSAQKPDQSMEKTTIASSSQQTAPSSNLDRTSAAENTAQVAFARDKTQTGSDSYTNINRDQIAFNPTGRIGESSSGRSPELSRPSQSTSITDRAGVISSALPNETVNREIPQAPGKDKEKDTYKEGQPPSYAKYGGAAPAEESAKPIIQHQKPQSFQSSLARDSAPEKAHSLSESLVTGKILSQPNKDGVLSSDSKSGESRLGDNKTAAARAADTKTGESKTIDARIPEGRSVDPRNLDSSHFSIGPTTKSSSEAQSLNSANFPIGQSAQGERIVLGATNPPQTGKPIESGTKSDSIHSDAASPDRSGKKPDGTDDKKETPATGKGPGSTTEPGKVPGSKAFNDLLDFIDKADQGDIKPGGKANVPLGGSNILSPDDVLITGTGAIGQIGIPTGKDNENEQDEKADNDKLSHRRKKYIVQPGDTLESIAKAELGDARYSSLILTINQANIASKVENGRKLAIRLQPEQVIWLPSDHEMQVHAEIYLLDS